MVEQLPRVALVLDALASEDWSRSPRRDPDSWVQGTGYSRSRREHKGSTGYLPGARDQGLGGRGQGPGATGRDAYLLVPCKGAHVRESLALLGVHEQRVLCFQPNRVYRTGSALLWPQPATCGGVRAPVAALLRHRVVRRELRPVADPQEVATPNMNPEP